MSLDDKKPPSNDRSAPVLVTMWVEADRRFRVESDACHVRGELRARGVAA